MKPCDFLSTACARTKVCRHLAWRCPRAWVSKCTLVEAPGYTASGRGQLAHRARTWPAQSVSHVVALCGLFLPPRARDQTQSVLLGPKNAARPRKSRRGLDLQPGGYDYGKPHILVRIRFRGWPTSTSKASTLQVFLSTACSWLLRLWAAVALLLSLAGSCRARHMVQGCYVSTRFVRLVFCRWATDLCARVAARLLCFRCLHGASWCRPCRLSVTGGSARR